MASSHFSGRYCPGCGSRLARDNTDALCAPCRKKAQDAVRYPPIVPPEFWETGDLKDALASWHMGSVIRAYRHNPFHGSRPLAQERVGGWLGTTQAQLSRIEQGQPIDDLGRLTRWAKILGIPGEYLWFKLPDQRSNDEPRAVEPSPAQSSATTPEETDDMDRTQFLLVGGSALASFLAAPLVHDWRESRHVPAVPELTDVVLDQARAQTRGFRVLDAEDGARQHLPAAARHARNLTSFWRLTDGAHPLRPQLAEVAADACNLVAHQAFDQGHRPRAIEWYNCSAGLADRADSQDLYVLGVCGEAWMHAKNGDAELALSVLHQLSGLPLSATARCYLAVYEAYAYAAGRRPDLAFRALDRAMVFSEQTRHEAPRPWFGVTNSVFVERYRAFILAQFGADEALSLLERLDQLTPVAFRSYRVTLATDRAVTYAHNGHLEPAAESLTSALLLNQRVNSVEKARRHLRVRAMLDPYQDTATVKTLDDVIHATKVHDLLRDGSVMAPGHPGPIVP